MSHSSNRFGPSRSSKNNKSKTSYGRSSKESISNEVISTSEELEKRRLKFLSNTQKKNEEYGLISRGEDNRLQRDPEARVRYFKEIQNTVRKLREALLKFAADEFTKSVFLFSIRISSRLGHYQTYIPSITYLLQNKGVLSKSELNEVASLYVLHAAHFSMDNKLALELFFKYTKDNLRLYEILKAWRSMNYKKWFEFYKTEKDFANRNIMKFGEEKMIKYALRVLQKTYFQLPKTYLQDLLFVDFDDLEAKYGFKWKLEGSTNIQRVTSLQKTLDDYIERYKKLLPLIEVVNKAMKIKPLDKRPSTVTIPKPAKAITTNTTKKAAPRKRQYNKKGSSSTNTPIPDELQSISETRNTGNQNTRPGAESHPIVI
ncbi:hypothetical protein WICMUC_005738 [Wickerhamomyces mucosus]|uniref:Uncharacterized protein n=1 Tax=Wickerhamomyces mucosus TaxID=1378264 RepID=A0A9P8T2Z7_9ASCO|nr:hypothetical protein WICMUC_005738 [Wickerhamomyces mucosus]